MGFNSGFKGLRYTFCNFRPFTYFQSDIQVYQMSYRYN